MNKQFTPALASLQGLINEFDQPAVTKAVSLLQKISRMALPADKHLVQYYEMLLFICAYPASARIRLLAEAELKRITLFLKMKKGAPGLVPYNEGLPYTYILTRFSPDFLRTILANNDLRVEFDSFYDASLSLNDVLNITLPSMLKAETTAGLSNTDLLDLLQVKPDEYASFLLGQFEQLQDYPLLKDLFMERLDMYVKLVPRNEKFSKAYNRIPVNSLYYHADLLKKFDHQELLHRALAPYIKPGAAETAELVKVIRNSMSLTVREIDPASFMEPASMRIWELERGLQIALYSMIPQRQLPLETYFGFTFFKNGIPISYGGIWAFGKLARLGLNIFEPYRGGESGYLLCQLMRVCRQALGVSYFEIEPYQFGLDNPGGIKSGAFWFYHKYGFRPVDKSLQQLAAAEYKKIKTKKNYRSPEKTLLRFTESNIFLNLEKTPPLDVLKITSRLLSAIKKQWANNYLAARQAATDQFCRETALPASGLTRDEKNILEETALWAMAMKVTNKEALQLMKDMVKTKTKDDYAYQQLVLAFFNT